AQEYSVQEIPLPPGFMASIDLPGTRGIQSLNQRGEMLATLYNLENDKAGCFIFQDARWRELTLDGRTVYGAAMNRRGDVVGQVLSDHDISRPFLFSKGRGTEIRLDGSFWGI